jgi:hypothetical protein
MEAISIAFQYNHTKTMLYENGWNYRSRSLIQIGMAHMHFLQNGWAFREPRS